MLAGPGFSLTWPNVACGHAKVPETWPGAGAPQVIDLQNVLHDIFSRPSRWLRLGRRTQAPRRKTPLRKLSFVRLHISGAFDYP